jgi:hypothetical protein
MSANGSYDTWLSNGDATFSAVPATTVPLWCASGATGCLNLATNHVVVGDFNGDGRTDFMSANSSFDTWLAK